MIIRLFWSFNEPVVITILAYDTAAYHIFETSLKVFHGIYCKVKFVGKTQQPVTQSSVPQIVMD